MTEPTNTAFDSLMSAYALRMEVVPWESVFTPEELEPMPPMDGPVAAIPGTSVMLCSRPQKFKDIESIRKFFLSGKNPAGTDDVFIMRWDFRQAFPSPAQVALGSDPNVPWGYFIWYAMTTKNRVREALMDVGHA